MYDAHTLFATTRFLYANTLFARMEYMAHTLELLNRALDVHPAPYWHDRLSLSRNALHQAKQRGHISPAIAGALAEELGEDAQKWIVVAALESERDSACKDRMMKKALNW